MQEVLGNRSVTHSDRSVGDGAASHVTGAQQEPSHRFPQRLIARCTRYRSAESPPGVTARRTLAAAKRRPLRSACHNRFPWPMLLVCDRIP